jgi:ATP-binding cassette subfamily F protein 3
MPVIAAANLTYAIGTRRLLDGASFSIEAGERVGLVGRNGQGKTTLMKILMGRIKPDSGSVTMQRGVRIGYLTQDPELDPTRTLRDEAAAGFVELAGVHAELDKVFEEMSGPDASDPVLLERLLKRQGDLERRIETLGGYAVDHKVDAILHGLGFTDAQFGVPVAGLSGGQKGRLGLAKLLLESPDVLLLDEPTNHLDIAGREWLEDFLTTEYSGAVLLVSHDRYLLDRVVSRIEEVERGRLIEYPGNYSAFREIRAQRLLTQNRAYENQQSQWAKEEEFIRRFKAGQRAKEAQGRLSKLERAKRDDAVERPAEMGAMKMMIPPAPRSGDMVLSVREASKKYANRAPAAGDDATGEPVVTGWKTLFNNFDLTIGRGERWAIIGPNGAGKTTLVKCILGELPLDEGVVRVGANVIVGYYAQLPMSRDEDRTIWQFLQEVIRKENAGIEMSEQKARDLAGAFLFSGQDQDKPLSALSGGERSRARLAALLCSAKNLLVLDEPTNHLDIPSAERLESVLAGRSAEGEGADPDADREGVYQGTLILISHDRALINATCDHLIILDGHGSATVFHGTYSEWHAAQKQAAAVAARAADDAKRRSASAPAAPSTWERARDSQPAAAQAKKDGKSKPKSGGSSSKGGGSGGTSGGAGGGVSWMPVERLEKEIEQSTARLKDLDAQLSDEAVYRDAAKCKGVLDERDAAADYLNKLEEEFLRRLEE